MTGKVLDINMQSWYDDDIKTMSGDKEMAEYFLRYADSEEFLQNDFNRGYSFKFYQFASSPEELLEEYLPEHLEDGDIDDLVEQFDIREHSDGQFGFALDGLCGYGPFETIEEAEEWVSRKWYNGSSDCGIFEGREGGADPDSDGTLFRPTTLVKVLEMAQV